MGKEGGGNHIRQGEPPNFFSTFTLVSFSPHSIFCAFFALLGFCFTFLTPSFAGVFLHPNFVGRFPVILSFFSCLFVSKHILLLCQFPFFFFSHSKFYLFFPTLSFPSFSLFLFLNASGPTQVLLSLPLSSSPIILIFPFILSSPVAQISFFSS